MRLLVCGCRWLGEIPTGVADDQRDRWMDLAAAETMIVHREIWVSRQRSRRDHLREATRV